MFSRFIIKKNILFKVAQKKHFSTFTSSNIPIVGVCVGCMALSFQLGVLYPWHQEINDRFVIVENLAKRIETVAINLDAKLSQVDQYLYMKTYLYKYIFNNLLRF